jgi:hypothetical protein
MKLIKASLLVLLAIIALEGKNALADDGKVSAGSASLSYQIVKEIKGALETPLLTYSDRDLNGDVTVWAKVEENGKINFIKIKSENPHLGKNTLIKLNELNLWTGKELSGNIFKYKVEYKQ